MGWLWGSKESRHDAEPSHSTQSSVQSFQTHQASPNDDAAAKIPPTRDELAEAELLDFLKSVQNEPTPQAPASLLSKASSQPTVPYSVPESTPTSQPITPAAIHPTTMSCRSAFDLAFYCQSIGGQFNSIYRQGTPRSCGQLWGDFWFCVRTNRGWMDDNVRKERVLEHYRKRERKYVDGPSSEDVWKARETMVVGAFEGDYEAVENLEKLMKGANKVDGIGPNRHSDGDEG